MRSSARNNIAILGATGSVGQSTIDVVESLGGKNQVFAITAHRRISELEALSRRCRPSVVALTCESGKVGDADRFKPSQFRRGPEQLVWLAQHPEVDTIVAAIVGSAGLLSCLAAAESGKRLALANKEALVVAGPLLQKAVAQGGGQLLPVDSEHSAIFQALQAGRNISEVRRIILTASGGSLRQWPIEQLSRATANDALNHPTWQMGQKITIDSATMMNKALEVIEARWLFQIDPSKIEVVIHPQSVIHSMVEFVDGSVVAQLSPPDMRLPIQYALTYPDRVPGPAKTIDWNACMQLSWNPVDFDRYPALKLGFEVAASGGTSGAVLNAANEAAVALFLDAKIGFTEITEACRSVVEHHNFDPSPSLECLLQLDRWAREEVAHWNQQKC